MNKGGAVTMCAAPAFACGARLPAAGRHTATFHRRLRPPCSLPGAPLRPYPPCSRLLGTIAPAYPVFYCLCLLFLGTMSAAAEPEWRFSQVFGDRVPLEDGLPNEADIISTVEFDRTGDFFASGDKGGRVVLFDRVTGRGARAGFEYRFYTEFQSHDPEFDYLKSVEIEEKINKIRWLASIGGVQFLLSANDKTIKLWKVYEKRVQQLTRTNLPGPGAHGLGVVPVIRTLRVPRLAYTETVISTTPRRTYSNAHSFHINSISPNSDNETYLSADDLRINVWNMEVSDTCFNILDIKPDNMEDLVDVITTAEFHPFSCNIFMYSSSNGSIKLGDMRAAALCDGQAMVFQEQEDSANESFFREIISSISDARFSPDGQYMLMRDYLTMRIWDVRMNSAPVRSFQIHEYLRPKLIELYDNDYLFDKFECTFSGDGQHLLTGSYHNLLHIISADSGQDVCVEASKSPPPKRRPTARTKLGLRRGRADSKKKAAEEQQLNVDTIDFNRKVLHVAWHPTQNLFSVAALTNLFFYRAL